MSLLDWIVLLGTLVVIVGYGVWKTRGTQDMAGYLRGGDQEKWHTIGLSVMATQASAITFLSTPGQAYQDGMRFIQFYFGMPLAMIVLSIVFLPRYFNLRVYTAYEFLESRFDRKTRQLTAFLFLLQRGLSAGITIYAPAIIVSSMLGWSLRLTCLGIGGAVILYTVVGGQKAVSQTQQQQMLIMLAGMGVAFIVVLLRLPPDISFGNTLRIAGALGKLDALDFSADPTTRYTLWSGLLGGFFLSLSYFGTDQSQVQRYLGARSLAASRFGLLFNGLFKIPMQALILFVGVMVFVFYQFNAPPLFFNQSELARAKLTPYAHTLTSLEAKHADVFTHKQAELWKLDRALDSHDPALIAAGMESVRAAEVVSAQVRAETKATLARALPDANTKDADYIFLTFVMRNLPRGLVGLLLVVILFAAMSSVAGELSALSSTTLVDFYRRSFRPEATDTHYVNVAKLFTAGWGILAVLFATYASMLDNLIQAVNILGSLFYGTILGIFLVAFSGRTVRGTSVCFAALIAEGLVVALFVGTQVSFLWYNVIGCLAVLLFAGIFEAVLPRRKIAGAKST